jgi:hypothetical protein
MAAVTCLSRSPVDTLKELISGTTSLHDRVSAGGLGRREGSILPMHLVLSMKTITISDDIHRRLSSIKAGMSFSEAIERLITVSVGVRTDRRPA